MSGFVCLLMDRPGLVIGAAFAVCLGGLYGMALWAEQGLLLDLELPGEADE